MRFGFRVTSVPISLTIVCAVTTLMPGTSVRSTPTIRYSSFRRSKVGSFFWRLGGAVSSVLVIRAEHFRRWEAVAGPSELLYQISEINFW